VFGVDRGLAEAHMGARMRIPPMFRFILRYVSPLYLIVIFAGFCWYNLPPYVESLVAGVMRGDPDHRSALYAWGVILGTIALLMAVTAIGVRRWRAAGLDIDDREDRPWQPAAEALTERPR
jgi:hypothetical protein